MGVMDFYKYIVKKQNGSYSITYQGKEYGNYQDITDALYDRDLFVDCDWDITEANARDEKPNRYKNMKLPPSRRYITLSRQGSRKYYVVRKTIDGEQVFFGKYKTFDEAVERRDELEANGWVRETN